MKKLLAFTLLLTMLLALAACGGANTGSGTSGTDEQALAELEEQLGQQLEQPTDGQAAVEPAAPEETAGDSADAPAEVFNVGVIQLVEHPALDAATRGFEEALIDLLGAEGVSFNEQNAQGESANCVTIANSLVSDNVDLILANATAALQAAASATSDIPILGTSITDYGTALDIDPWTGTTGRNISGTSDLAPLDGQAEMLAELFPAESHPNVGIIYCSAEANSVYQANTIEAILEDLGYTVTQYTFADSNDIASVVTSACDASDVLYVPTDNTAANNAAAIDNVALPAGVPIVAGEEGICAGCGAATLSISYYDLGYATGLMAYDILVGGADVSAMNVEFAPQFTKEYDAERCAALGISVPDDYVAIGG